MERNNYCVIMAGGVGTRFWPLSRQSAPKQFLDILGTGKSFIRHTYERFARIVPDANFLVMTNRAYKDMVLAHIPELREEQVLCEPIGRNTAPCIAYAAFRLSRLDAKARMIVTPADHWIADEPQLLRVVGECLSYTDSNDVLMTIGLKPTRPETGYGYIQVTDPGRICKVKSFTEKPNAEMARIFVESGEFFWNSGIFIWQVESIMRALLRYLPEHYNLFSSIADSYGTPREGEAVERVFAECRAISIDYGIMEKADNVYVECGDFGWSDVGTWSSLYQHWPKDEHGNALSEGCLAYGTRDTIVSLPREKVAVVSGLEDYIVVDTPDVLLICPRSDEQNIKKFIDEVKFRKGDGHI